MQPTGTSTSAQGQLSPDGNYWWNGTSWVPIRALPPQQPSATPAPFAVRTASPARRVSWTVIAGAVTAALGAVVVLIACFVPYATYSDSNGSGSVSVFSPGFGGGFWYAIEPVLVVVLTILAAVFVSALSIALVRALCAGAMIALGAQTFALFVGYVGGAPSIGSIAPGGFIGTFGGILILAGGVTAFIGVAVSARGPRP